VITLAWRIMRRACRRVIPIARGVRVLADPLDERRLGLDARVREVRQRALQIRSRAGRCAALHVHERELVAPLGERPVERALRDHDAGEQRLDLGPVVDGFHVV
jgi:hypothetical protein